MPLRELSHRDIMAIERAIEQSRMSETAKDNLYAKLAAPVTTWVPVGKKYKYAEPLDPTCWTSTLTAEKDGAVLTIAHTEGDEYERTVDLPDGVRLCRVVKP